MLSKIKNFSYSVGINVLSKIFAIVLGLYSVRWINENFATTERADFAIMENVVGIVLGFAGLGLTVAIQKYYTNTKFDREETGDFWTTFLMVRIITFFVGYAIMMLTPLIYPGVSLLYFLAVYSFSFLVAMDYNFFGVYAATQQTWKFSLTDFIGKCVIVFLLFNYQRWFITSFSVFDFFIFASIFGYSTSLLLDFILIKKFTPITKVKFKIFRNNFKTVKWLALSSAIVGLYQLSQTSFLRWLGSSDLDIASFDNANRIVFQGVMVAGVVVPQLATMVKNQMDGLETGAARTKRFLKLLSGLSVLSIAGYFLIVLLGPFILNIIDPNVIYKEARNLLPVLGLFAVFNTISSLVTYVAIFYNQERHHFIAIALQAIISLALYTFMTKSMGLYGIAWAVVIVSAIDLLIIRLPHTLRVINKSVIKETLNQAKI